MTLRRGDLDALRSLLPLHPSDDLTDEEARRVDEALRYSGHCRNEVAAYSECLAVLRSVSAEPTPMDERPSLWNRIEPRLGPAGRLRRPRLLSWVSTPQLAAACIILSLFNIALIAPAAMQGRRPALLTAARGVGNVPEIPVIADRWQNVDPEYNGVIVPLIGATVAELDEKHGRVASHGVIVGQLIKGASGEMAGLRADDIITQVDGCHVKCPDCIRKRLSTARDGQLMTLTIVRGTEAREITVKVHLGGIWREMAP